MHVLQKQLAVFLKHFHSYHESYFQVLRSLHAMTSSLPQYPLGKQVSVPILRRNNLLASPVFSYANCTLLAIAITSVDMPSIKKRLRF